MTAVIPLAENPATPSLRRLADQLARADINRLLTDDPGRANQYCASGAGITLDYSKHLLNNKALGALLNLARGAELEGARDALLRGEPVNNTEGRPALHSLLRAATCGDADPAKFAEVQAVRLRMQALVESLWEGARKSFSGAAFTDVVNIGIGGSDLGPRLATEALASYHGPLAVHYVANIDPADLEQTLSGLNPDTTLIIVCSKSFCTEETRVNALSARQWLFDAGAVESSIGANFFAITSNFVAAKDFGIPEAHCLPLWDWVGGRFSLWSAVGLSTACAIGWPAFEQLLEGAAAMDRHFAEAPLGENLPVLMSLLEIWYTNFMGAGNHVVLPYSHPLALLPSFLQQLTMESNGKQVDRDGKDLEDASAPVLWGEAGTRGQHSFHQHLHQGTWLCPVDFILPLAADTSLRDQHRRLVAHCLAQSRALMVGRRKEEARQSLVDRGETPERADALATHLEMTGNRPSSVITLPRLTPEHLGALLALYEHRTYCSGQLWGLNSFDQWGVELGKEIGAQVLAQMDDRGGATLDPATERLLAAWRAVNHS